MGSGPTLLTPFNLNYLDKGLLISINHAGAWGFNIWIWRNTDIQFMTISIIKFYCVNPHRFHFWKLKPCWIMSVPFIYYIEPKKQIIILFHGISYLSIIKFVIDFLLSIRHCSKFRKLFINRKMTKTDFHLEFPLC